MKFSAHLATYLKEAVVMWILKYHLHCLYKVCSRRVNTFLVTLLRYVIKLNKFSSIGNLVSLRYTEMLLYQHSLWQNAFCKGIWYFGIIFTIFLLYWHSLHQGWASLLDPEASPKVRHNTIFFTLNINSATTRLLKTH